MSWIRGLLSLCGIAIIAMACIQVAPTASANEMPERRVALVIGNSAYRSVPALRNPRNDAEDVTAALKADGFEVIGGQDLDRRGMGEVLARFSREASGADVALFFFAGHGLQLKGENYLIPVDSALTDEFDIPFETTRVTDVMDALDRSKGVRILILDACRNNPIADRMTRFAKTRDVEVRRGLAHINQNKGMIIAYATQANEVAVDGRERNSPFSASLIEQLKEPGLEVSQLFRRVAANVNKRTDGAQTPELSVSLLGDFYFNRGETDVQAWIKLRDSNNVEALHGFLNKFPSSVLGDAAKARLDVIERALREETLRKQLASYEREKLKAADEADAARQADATLKIREKAERERLAASLAEARQKAQEEAARQQAEQDRRFKERLTVLEAENRKAQAELLARSEEQARRAKDDKEREREAAERDRLAAAQAERMKAAAAEAKRQKSDEDQKLATRLAKLEEGNRQATAELATRAKAEEAMRATAERERSQLVAALDAERRKAADELQRVQREKDEAAVRQQTAAKPAAQPPVAVANLSSASTDSPAGAPTQPAHSAPPAPSLVFSIKRELERLGCYRGQLDENWASPQAKRSVREFARLAHLDAPNVPDPAFLDKLKAQRDRVCPVVCGPWQLERGGVCVAKTCLQGQHLDADGNCVVPPTGRNIRQPRHAAPTPARSTAPSKRLAQQTTPERAPRPRIRATAPQPATASGNAGYGGRCFRFNGQAFCE